MLTVKGKHHATTSGMGTLIPVSPAEFESRSAHSGYEDGLSLKMSGKTVGVSGVGQATGPQLNAW